MIPIVPITRASRFREVRSDTEQGASNSSSNKVVVVAGEGSNSQAEVVEVASNFPGDSGFRIYVVTIAWMERGSLGFLGI